MDRLSTAIEIAVIAHAGQKDKLGRPYIFHPIYVAMQMETEEEQIIAILHDVIEDGVNKLFTNEMTIVNKLGREIHGHVKTLTRLPEEDYLTEYIPRVKEDPLATTVKIADLRHNLERNQFLPEPERKRLKDKYTKALFMLLKEEKNDSPERPSSRKQHQTELAERPIQQQSDANGKNQSNH